MQLSSSFWWMALINSRLRSQGKDNEKGSAEDKIPHVAHAPMLRRKWQYGPQSRQRKLLVLSHHKLIHLIQSHITHIMEEPSIVSRLFANAVSFSQVRFRFVYDCETTNPWSSICFQVPTYHLLLEAFLVSWDEIQLCSDLGCKSEEFTGPTVYR